LPSLARIAERIGRSAAALCSALLQTEETESAPKIEKASVRDGTATGLRRLAMQSWDLRSVDAEPHQPQILASADDARTIVLQLPEGEELQEHEVHERARVVLVDGEVDVTTAGGEVVLASAGHLFEFDPGERRTIAARSDARLLLILTPWPGDGHPGAMTLEQKGEARERAAQHQLD
jgi:quercetin dioxygenase-like cupin family protein